MSSPQQIARAHTLRALHDRRRVLLLPNAWDAASTRMLADLGFPAIATTSGGMAWSLGHADGEQAPLEEVLAALRRMVRATPLPLTADMEAGFGQTPQAVAECIRATLDAGVVGVNLEDGIRHQSLRGVDDAAGRIAAARQAAVASGVPLFINARVDAFMIRRGDDPAEVFEDALRRAHAYLAAGADGIFPIGLSDPQVIARLCAQVDAPVNIMAFPGLPPLAELGRLGVARVSTATQLASLALSAARSAAEKLRTDGDWSALRSSFGYPDMQRLSGHS